MLSKCLQIAEETAKLEVDCVTRHKKLGSFEMSTVSWPLSKIPSLVLFVK